MPPAHRRRARVLHCCGNSKSASLQRLVRLYRTLRLRDRVTNRGRAAKKENSKEPKPYPLESYDWSSCDESEEEPSEFAVELPAVAVRRTV